MGWHDFFKRKRPLATAAAPSLEIERDEFIGSFLSDDYLGKAAEAGHNAKAAVRARRFDDAWRFYHAQKSLYMEHAKASGFTGAQALALDASVSEHLANILRMEKKHDDALVHILYWALTSRPTKSIQKKLPVYFNRCNFQRVQFNAAESMMRSQTQWTFSKVKDQVRLWRGAAV